MREKRISFLNCFLCLSRACLGKIFVYIYKRLKKRWRIIMAPSGNHLRRAVRGRLPAETRLVLSFPYVCPEPVLGNVRFLAVQNGKNRKKTCFAPRHWLQPACCAADLSHTALKLTHRIYHTACTISSSINGCCCGRRRGGRP